MFLGMTKAIAEFLVIFSIGSAMGWWLEFFYRGFFKKGHKIVNPGFLSGPYLPIYGFGAFLLYILGKIPLGFWGHLLLFTLGATLLEYITGLFFLKVYNIRLWDYRDEWGNLSGFICPLFTLFWMIAGVVGLLWIYPLLEWLVTYVKDNIHISFYFGLFYGVFLSDMINSFNVAAKLAKSWKKLQESEGKLRESLHYSQLRQHLSEFEKKIKLKNKSGRYFTSFNISRADLERELQSFKEKNSLKKLVNRKRKA